MGKMFIEQDGVRYEVLENFDFNGPVNLLVQSGMETGKMRIVPKHSCANCKQKGRNCKAYFGTSGSCENWIAK